MSTMEASRQNCRGDEIIARLREDSYIYLDRVSRQKLELNEEERAFSVRY